MARKSEYTVLQFSHQSFYSIEGRIYILRERIDKKRAIQSNSFPLYESLFRHIKYTRDRPTYMGLK